jgi:hypothetical protein
MLCRNRSALGFTPGELNSARSSASAAPRNQNYPTLETSTPTAPQYPPGIANSANTKKGRRNGPSVNPGETIMVRLETIESFPSWDEVDKTVFQDRVGLAEATWELVKVHLNHREWERCPQERPC